MTSLRLSKETFLLEFFTGEVRPQHVMDRHNVKHFFYLDSICIKNLINLLTRVSQIISDSIFLSNAIYFVVKFYNFIPSSLTKFPPIFVIKKLIFSFVAFIQEVFSFRMTIRGGKHDR